MTASIRDRLQSNHPDIHVQHHDTHTVLFEFNDDVDSIPAVCFCLHIFRVLVLVYIFKGNCIIVESTLGDHTDTAKIYQKWILVRKMSILLASRIRWVSPRAMRKHETLLLYLSHQRWPYRYIYNTYIPTLLIAFQIHNISPSCYLHLKVISQALYSYGTPNQHVSRSTNFVAFLKLAMLKPNE